MLKPGLGRVLAVVLNKFINLRAPTLTHERAYFSHQLNHLMAHCYRPLPTEFPAFFTRLPFIDLAVADLLPKAFYNIPIRHAAYDCHLWMFILGTRQREASLALKQPRDPCRVRLQQLT